MGKDKAQGAPPPRREWSMDTAQPGHLGKCKRTRQLGSSKSAPAPYSTSDLTRTLGRIDRQPQRPDAASPRALRARA